MEKPDERGESGSEGIPFFDEICVPGLRQKNEKPKTAKFWCKSFLQATSPELGFVYCNDCL